VSPKDEKGVGGTRQFNRGSDARASYRRSVEWYELHQNMLPPTFVEEEEKGEAKSASNSNNWTTPGQRQVYERKRDKAERRAELCAHGKPMALHPSSASGDRGGKRIHQKHA